MDWIKKEVYPFSALVGQERMKRALILSAIEPSIGGLLIRGEKGTAKSTAVRGLASILPEIEVVSGCPFSCDPHQYELLCPECKAKVKKGVSLPIIERKTRVVDLPLGATEDRVVGTLDLEYAIKEGRRRFTPGLLAEANRGILYIDEVNLVNDHIVDIILDAAGMGMNIVEREGISYLHPAKFILIGTMNPEEGELRPQLLDRFGMCIQIEGVNDPGERVKLIKGRESFDRDSTKFIRSHQAQQHELSQRIVRARKRFSRVKVSDKMIQLFSKLAKEAFVAGHRADIIMRKVALAIASWEGRDEVIEEDVHQAAELVLLHRGKIPPPPAQSQPQKDEEPFQTPPEEESPEKEKEKVRSHERRKSEGREAEAKEGTDKGGQKSKPSDIPTRETIFPIGETFKAKNIQMERDRILRKGSGRRSRTRTPSKAGRYIMSRIEREINDLALDATLRAAAPHQIKRKREDVAIAIEESDIREKVREKRIGNFIVFVVDASGSMGAGRRMIETKGAILSLLMDAYQKRDKVTLVAFKEDHAEVLLPPTNSIELTYKLLEELPVGGKTPLPHGLTLGYQIIKSYFHKDPNIYPMMVLISDGKANVNVYGGKPVDESMDIAGEIKDDSRIKTVVIDVEKPGLVSFGLAYQLSIQMGAKYFQLEDLRADTLVGVLRGEILEY